MLTLTRVFANSEACLRGVRTIAEPCRCSEQRLFAGHYTSILKIFWPFQSTRSRLIIIIVEKFGFMRDDFRYS